MNLILDNVAFALQRAGGISVYWYELLRRLNRDGRAMRMVEHPRAAENIFRRQLDPGPAAILRERRLPLWLSRYLPYPAGDASRPLCHSSYYRRPQAADAVEVVTVYDFTYERFRQGVARRVHSWQKATAIRAAHGVICISESTRCDLLERYPDVPPDRVRVIHLGAAEDYRPLGTADPRTRPADLPQAPFLLFVGARDSYKNFRLALEAVAALPDYHLLSAGGGPLRQDESELAHQMLPGRHTHLASVDNEALNRLYNSAHALIYPSSYEGFGIPVLEAMAAGCPVIAVNASSIPEAAGDAGLLVDEICAEAFAQKIVQLEDEALRRETIDRGHANAKRFSWEKCYRETMAFHDDVYARQC